MEERSSSPTMLVVSSPHRMPGLLRNFLSSAFASRYDSAFPVHDKHTRTDDSSGSGLTGDHGPKPSQVYGFVGSITTVITTVWLDNIKAKLLDKRISAVMYLVWAYTPEPWLHFLGITYYPSKYWMLAIPSFVIDCVFYDGALFGFEFLGNTSAVFTQRIYDEYSRKITTFIPLEGMEKPIDLISDVGIDQINHLMFGNANQ